MPRIFISYRRDDSSQEAQKLHQRLSGHFGQDQVGLDLDFEPGLNYLDLIRDAVGSCEVLIVVIGKNWLKAADHAGRRRLDQDLDLVRLEIKTALDRGLRVIPVRVAGARMPERLDLPEALSQLALLQAVDDDEARVTKLIPVIERVLGRTRGSTAASGRGTPPPSNPSPQGSLASTQIGTAAYLFRGHAIGASGRFGRLENVAEPCHSRRISECRFGRWRCRQGEH